MLAHPLTLVQPSHILLFLVANQRSPRHVQYTTTLMLTPSVPGTFPPGIFPFYIYRICKNNNVYLNLMFSFIFCDYIYICILYIRISFFFIIFCRFFMSNVCNFFFLLLLLLFSFTSAWHTLISLFSPLKIQMSARDLEEEKRDCLNLQKQLYRLLKELRKTSKTTAAEVSEDGWKAKIS